MVRAPECAPTPVPLSLARPGAPRLRNAGCRTSGHPLEITVLSGLEDAKAEDIISIDLKGKTSLADMMIIATGRSTPMLARSRIASSRPAAMPAFPRPRSRACRFVTGCCSTRAMSSSTSSGRTSGSSTISRNCGAPIAPGGPEGLSGGAHCARRRRAAEGRPGAPMYDRYLKRLSDSARGGGLAGVDARELPELRARRPEDRRAEEAAAIRAAIPGRRVCPCRRTGRPTSPQWAADIGAARDRPPVMPWRSADLTASIPLNASAHRTIGFGAMTWPHQLVRIMAAEQLYRVVAILSGHPYHRA